MRIPTIQIVILLINKAKGSDTTDDYDCHGEICIPKGYDPLDSPINVETNNPLGSGKMKMTWVYFNFLDMKELVKKVDENKMMITFQATAIMVWADPRLKTKSKISGIVPLPDLLKRHIWTPSITVDQPDLPPSSPYQHPYTYSKDIFQIIIPC